MKNLRKLSAALILVCALAFPIFAGQTETPPCSLPEPGQTETPPCGTFSDMETPTVASTAAGDVATTTNSETSFTEIAANVLLNFLPLF